MRLSALISSKWSYNYQEILREKLPKQPFWSYIPDGKEIELLRSHVVAYKISNECSQSADLIVNPSGYGDLSTNWNGYAYFIDDAPKSQKEYISKLNKCLGYVENFQVDIFKLMVRERLFIAQ